MKSHFQEALGSLPARPALLLALYGLLLAVRTLSPHHESAHSTSRFATIESLVANGTFAIDSSTYVSTFDKVKIGPHFYSHQPPAHAILTAILYFPVYHLGLHFREGRDHVADLLAYLTNGLCTVFTLILFYRTLKRFGIAQETRVWIAAVVACGTLILPYSVTLNVHGVVAAILFVGLYCLLRSAASGAWLFLSGLAFSVAASMDHGAIFFFAAFGFCVLLRRGLSAAIWFVLPAMLTLGPTFAYYYAIGGSLKPFASRQELFLYPGSYWLTASDPVLHANPEKLTGGALNSPAFALRYGALLLFGPRGFLVYNPILAIALYGILRTIRLRLQFWPEALAVLGGSLAMVVYFAFASTNFSGSCYSIRWFVAWIYLWCFFLPPALHLWTTRRWLVLALAGLSVVYAFGGAIDPWSPPDIGYAAPLKNAYRRLYLLHLP